jgi:hypothetical protein
MLDLIQLMTKEIETQVFGSQIQSRLPTRSEARLRRGILWCSAWFLATALILTAHQIYIHRTFAAHLAAGGIDDPDAVFNRAHILIIPLVVLPMIMAFIGLVTCSVGWSISRLRRHNRARRPLRQW